MLDHITSKNVNNTFGYLVDMCKLLPCNLGTMSSQSFLERMNSAANLLVTNNRLMLRDNFIDKSVVLRMNKYFMTFAQKDQPLGFLFTLSTSKT